TKVPYTAATSANGLTRAQSVSVESSRAPAPLPRIIAPMKRSSRSGTLLGQRGSRNSGIKKNPSPITTLIMPAASAKTLSSLLKVVYFNERLISAACLPALYLQKTMHHHDERNSTQSLGGKNSQPLACRLPRLSVLFCLIILRLH